MKKLVDTIRRNKNKGSLHHLTAGPYTVYLLTGQYEIGTYRSKK